MRSRVGVSLDGWPGFQGGELALTPGYRVNDIVHRVASRLTHLGVDMRHHSVTEMLKPAMNPLRTIRHKITRQPSSTPVALERPGVKSMDGQRKRLKQWIGIGRAMLRDQVTRLDGLLHGGDAIVKQPPPLAFVYRGLFHFMQNVKEHAPLSARAGFDHGVEFESTEKHVNRAADRGCCVSSCSTSVFAIVSTR